MLLEHYLKLCSEFCNLYSFFVISVPNHVLWFLIPFPWKPHQFLFQLNFVKHNFIAVVNKLRHFLLYLDKKNICTWNAFRIEKYPFLNDSIFLRNKMWHFLERAFVNKDPINVLFLLHARIYFMRFKFSKRFMNNKFIFKNIL